MIDEFLTTYTEIEFWLDVHTTIAAALIIGIANYILRKYGSLAINRVLSVITLGSYRVKRRIYQRIAGLHHSGYGEFLSSLGLDAALIGLVTAFVLMSNIFNINTLNELLVDIDNAETRVWVLLEFQESPKRQSEFAFLEELQEQRDEVEEVTSNRDEDVLTFRFFLVLITAFVIYKYLTLSYVNAAQVHFRKALDLCGPYCREEERLEYLSLFARIESKEDYENLLDRIYSVLKDNEISLPEFIVW
ncbi:MAG: hypothetical protein RPU61_04045 [Candidatus Sedimenticola sp. (ex Thyasira tokunagai)]